MAIFAIITSAQQSALLKSLPACTGTRPSEEELKYILRYIIRRPSGSTWLMAIFSCQKKEKADFARRGHRRGFRTSPDWNMVYIWQYPLMLMAWSWVTFLIALTMHVSRSLLSRRNPGDNRQVRLVYLTLEMAYY
jgi:hypothetical protein